MNTSVYDTLYNNMKNKFTVVNNDCEYTLGEYMLKKANNGKTTSENTRLPACRTNTSNAKIVSIFSYVNDKLTVKAPPVKDKTIRAFPFRTSAAALLSAIVACALMFSYGLFSVRNAATSNQPMVEASEQLPEEESQELDK